MYTLKNYIQILKYQHFKQSDIFSVPVVQSNFQISLEIMVSNPPLTL